ncbi:MAG: M20/M25/M40 family metallo-hydrolase [Treponema sp.]|jgi:tripeptide aminopeptidase|nr:M20/M25/M40 family metallo-hydrolase [Treponema sp.]
MMICYDLIIKVLYELLEIHGESKHESRVAEYIKKYVERLSKRFAAAISIECDHISSTLPDMHCNNLMVKIAGTEQSGTVLLSAHMDTVITGGTVIPKQEGEYIVSAKDTILGADDRAGIAIILAVVETLLKKNIPHPPLLLVFSVAEELGLLGARYCNLSSKDAVMGVVLDGGGEIGTIIYQAPYYETWKITVLGRSAHAGIEPENGINAISRAAQLIAKLPTGRIDSETTANIAQIHGGIAKNIVPDTVIIEGEIRSLYEKKHTELIALYRSVCESYNDKEKTVIFEHNRGFNGFSIPQDSLVIEKLSAAAKVIGKNPVLKSTGGGSDANFFNQYGIPSAVISCGMDKVHTYNERIKISDLIDAAEMVYAFLCAIE